MNKERGRAYRLVIEGKDFFLSLICQPLALSVCSLFLLLCVSLSLFFSLSLPLPPPRLSLPFKYRQDKQRTFLLFSLCQH